MSLTKKAIIKIANLACLQAYENNSDPSALQDNSSIDDIREHLNNILQLVDQISDTDTSQITPMAHPLEDSYQRLRIDAVTEENVRSKMQEVTNAKAKEAGLYLVPKVVDN